MNKIVREHYPASKLPEELRAGLSPDASVKVTVEEEASRAVDTDQRDRAVERHGRRMTRQEFLKSIRDAQSRAKGVTIEEAVARIRELRDEWDD